MSAIRRSRSNDGTPSHTESLFPLGQRDLARLLIIFGPDAKVEKVKHTYHGPKAARGCPQTSYTDEQVLEIRRLQEWHGMKRAAIAKLLNLPVDSLHAIVEWRNRVHLDPGPRPMHIKESA